MSSLDANGPRITASVIVLNNVSVVAVAVTVLLPTFVMWLPLKTAVNKVKCLNMKQSEEAQETEHDN